MVLAPYIVTQTVISRLRGNIPEAFRAFSPLQPNRTANRSRMIIHFPIRLDALVRAYYHVMCLLAK